MKTAIDSSTQAVESKSEEHPGDSPDKTPEESSGQIKLEKQLEIDTDMMTSSDSSFYCHLADERDSKVAEKREEKLDGILNAGVT